MRGITKIMGVFILSGLLTACGSEKNENIASTEIPQLSEQEEITELEVTNGQEPVLEKEPGADEESVNEKEPEKVEETTDIQESEEEKAVAISVDFKEGMPSGFEASNGWSNGSMFNVTWRKANVTFENERMQLMIDNDTKPKNGIPYSGGEVRSKDFYGYGKYEVSMKAVKNDGIVNSFFTYTGPTDKNPWDEIDIEFLGKDTTKVQFNYFTNGRGNHEYIHDLGFDAAEDFHVYGFEWYEDKIIWYVDGEAVHTATMNIPSTKGKIMMNAWCGTGVDDWLKAFDDSNLPIAAEYEWVKYTPFE